LKQAQLRGKKPDQVIATAVTRRRTLDIDHCAMPDMASAEAGPDARVGARPPVSGKPRKRYLIRIFPRYLSLLRSPLAPDDQPRLISLTGAQQ